MPLTSPQTMTILVGLALIVISILGEGIEVKEIKIPTLPALSRALGFFGGVVLLVLGLGFPRIFDSPSNAAASVTPTVSASSTVPVSNVVPAAKEEKSKFLGAAIQNHLTTVHDVKRALRRLGKYSGPIDDETGDSYFQAVGEFQVSQNLEADGLVGPATYKKLRETWPELFEMGSSSK